MNPPGLIHKAENVKKNHDSALTSTSLVSEQYGAWPLSLGYRDSAGGGHRHVP